MLLASDVSPYLQVFGRFHIVLLHLPIGLLPGIFLLEMGSMMFKRTIPRGSITVLTVMAALAAGAAFAAGWVLANEKNPSDLLSNHKNAAIAMTVCCALLPLLAILKNRLPFRIALTATVALSVVAGHLGGSLTHREDFLFKPLQKAAQTAQQRNAPTSQNEQMEGAQKVDPGDANGRYVTQIAPILERGCTSCHNPEDEEGDLDMSTLGSLLAGWDENEKIIVPGDIANSPFVEVLTLPSDDDLHMPPEDETQLTKLEIATLTQWVADGCPK